MGSFAPNPYTNAPSLCMCSFVVYLSYQGINPLFATLPPPVTSMSVHVCGLST